MSFIKQKIREKLYGSDVRRMVEQNKIPDPRVSLERLKKLGFEPNIIFDIGAYQGDFSEMCFAIWPETKIYAFEALHEKIDLLKIKFKLENLQVVEGIIGSEDKDDITFYSDETASSVLISEEVDTRKKVISQKMRKIESLIKSDGLPIPNFLKIDTQGYEYEILKGCGNSLQHIDVLLLEVNFIEVYQNVKLAHEVIDYLSHYGFVIYDICEIHRRPLDMALFQADLLFVKQESFLRKDKRWGESKI